MLALQGGFAAHVAVLRAIGHDAFEVRDPHTLATVDGLVLPGGESTTQMKLIDRFGLRPALDEVHSLGRPILVTCAGLILAARAVTEPEQPSFGWIDVDVRRNAWGRQVHSFVGTADPPADLPLLFIRAPRITRVGRSVEILAELDGEPVLVRQGRLTAATFHPELTADRRVHSEVFGMVHIDLQANRQLDRRLG